MLELRSLLRLKVGQFSQESRQLKQDDKDLLVVWLIPPDKPFETLVVLSHWIVLILLQQLPILSKLVLGLGIIQNTEDLDARDKVLQSLPVLGFLVLEYEFIDLSQRE